MKRSDQWQERRSEWWVRAAWMVAFVLWFIWVGLEDRSTSTVLIMSAAPLLAAWLTLYMRRVKRLPGPGAGRFAAILLLGLVAGLLVTPTAVVLMAVKIALHNHALPEFTRVDVTRVLSSTPAWALGALMLGAAGALLDHTRS
jgi:hypothetical protein